MAKKKTRRRLQTKLHIKKGDVVKVLTGESKGKEGRVLDVLISKRRAFVEGVNIVSKHKKADQQNQKGGITKQEAAVHISNLMVIDGSTGEATRVGRRVEDGKLQRYSKKTGKIIK